MNIALNHHFHFLWRSPGKRSFLEVWNARSRNVDFHFLRTSPGKRSFLEVRIFTFADSLLENLRFGSVDFYLLRTSRGNARFGRLDYHFLRTSPGPLENARFGSVDLHFLQTFRGKRSFWKFGCSLFANVFWETLVLESFRKGKGKSKEFVFSLWLAVQGAFAVPLGCWKVSAREFTFQFVAVRLGFAFSIFTFFAWLAVLLVSWDSACVIFFAARCSRCVCSATWLL